MRTVAFADVAGQLVLSQASGLCRIPACRWCPQRLLAAVERAERHRKQRGTISSSSRVSGDTGGPTEAGGVDGRVPPKIKSPPDGGLAVTARVDDEGGYPLAEPSNTEDYARLDQQRDELAVHNITSRGRRIGGETVDRGEINTFDQHHVMAHGSTATKNLFIGKRRYTAADDAAAGGGRQITTGKGRDRKRVVSAQECIMPSEMMGNGGLTPAPFTSIWRPVKKESFGVDRANPERSEASMSILDRMKAKVAGMSTSPPPLDARSTKVSLVIFCKETLQISISNAYPGIANTVL